jgi:hypothetical protein
MFYALLYLIIGFVVSRAFYSLQEMKFRRDDRRSHWEHPDGTLAFLMFLFWPIGLFCWFIGATCTQAFLCSIDYALQQCDKLAARIDKLATRNKTSADTQNS